MFNNLKYQKEHFAFPPQYALTKKLDKCNFIVEKQVFCTKSNIRSIQGNIAKNTIHKVSLCSKLQNKEMYFPYLVFQLWSMLFTKYTK